MGAGSTWDTGDREIAALFIRGRRNVRAVLRRKGIRGRDVDDLTHEVFVRALESTGVTLGWLCETARRVAANHRRLHRHVVEVLNPKAIDEAPAPPEDGEARVAVRRALEFVEPEERDLLVRFGLLGEVLTEIAPGMRLSKSGAHVRLEKARGRFRERFSGA